jgi:hypothetical protein
MGRGEQDREWQRIYRVRHPERVKAAQKRYRQSERGRLKANERAKKYRTQDPEKSRQRCRDWYKNNKESVIERNRWYKRKRQFGLTREAFFELLTSQGNKCAACGSADPGTKGWMVDHCHTNGHVRGILCHHCNAGLGHARDDIAVLEKWIKYLTPEVI